MAVADQRRLTATAETAASLLAHHWLFQNFRDQFGGRALADRPGHSGKRRAHIFNRRETKGLLARIFCGPDLSLQLWHGHARARGHARAGIQRLYRRRDFLRRVRLSTAARTQALVLRVLDLLRTGVPHEKFARVDLSPGHSRLAVVFLSPS